MGLVPPVRNPERAVEIVSCREDGKFNRHLVEREDVVWTWVRLVLDLDRVAPEQNQITDVSVELRDRPRVHTVAQVSVADLVATNVAGRGPHPIEIRGDVQTRIYKVTQPKKPTDPEQQTAFG